jgi:hypothetical protein
MTLRDKILATVRTTVAGGVAAVLTWAAVHLHIVLSPHDSAAVQGAVFLVLLAVYHSGASWLQRRWAGWAAHRPWLRHLAWAVALLLGTAQQPVGYVTALRAGNPRPPTIVPSDRR